jgi:hypothetical protein
MYTMKKLLSILILSSAAFCYAQNVPNGGFENWQTFTNSGSSVQIPQHWWTLDVLAAAFNPTYTGQSTVKTTQSHSGNYAILFQTAINSGDTVNGFIFSSDSVGSFGLSHGFACSSRPSALSGYYKLNLTGGDSAGILLFMSKWNGNHRDTLVNKTFVFSTNISSYTQFNIPITYSSSQFPDSAIIEVGIIGPAGKVSHVGTQLFLDDLTFSGSVPAGIKEINSDNELISFYPNPFSDKAVVDINNTVNLNNTRLVIYDITGKEVKKIDQIHSRQVTISRDKLESGVYFYKLFNDQIVTANGKFILE